MFLKTVIFISRGDLLQGVIVFSWCFSGGILGVDYVN